MGSLVRQLRGDDALGSPDEKEDEVQSFLNHLDDLIQNEEPRRAIDAIFQQFNALLLAGNFDLCDKILAKVDLERVPPLLLASFLTITAAAKDKLPYRATFYREARRRVEAQRGSDGADRLLSGLE